MTGSPALRKVCLLIHGISNWPWSEPKIFRLRPELEAAGFEAVAYNWGLGFVLRPMLGTGRYARQVRELAERYAGEGAEVFAVAHSHGANILGRACREGAPFKVVALVNAAADENTDFGRVLAVNFFTRMDPVLGMTRLWPVQGDGRLGMYSWGKKQRWRPERKQVDMLGMFGVKGHSEAFENADTVEHIVFELEHWGRWLRNPPLAG